MSTNRLVARSVAAVAVAGLLGLAAAGTAAAHVTANPGTATKGGYAKITFRVPTEDPTAGTVKLQITLPKDHPLASVSTKPVPGWKAEVVKAKLDQPVKLAKTTVTEAVTTVTWTADPGVRVEPGQFNEFDISAGPLPDNTDTLVIPAVQTYDSGKVVNWDQPTPAGGAEPEHPAPTIKLVAATSGDAHDMADTHTEAAAVTSSDDTARWLGGAGLVVGALGLGVGVGAVLRSRRGSGAAGGSGGAAE